MTNENDIKEAISFYYDALQLAVGVIEDHAAEHPTDFPTAASDLAAIRAAAESHKEVLVAAGLLDSAPPVTKDPPGEEPRTSVAEAVEKLSSPSSTKESL
jgi:hypothetical protein